jgi:hypothetical protein
MLEMTCLCYLLKHTSENAMVFVEIKWLLWDTIIFA